MPEHGLSYKGGWLEPIKYWWVDSDKKEALINARKNNISLPITDEVIDYWNILDK